MDISPTKSNLLSLRRQLAFAQEGFDLLEEKRQLLVFELMKRFSAVRSLEATIVKALAEAHSFLAEAELSTGSLAVDAAAAGSSLRHQLALQTRHFVGLEIPMVDLHMEPLTPQFGVVGTSAYTDEAMKRFFQLLPLLAHLAEAQTTIMRLAAELRKTQRRCNALSKIFIPRHLAAIHYISGFLEEREREDFIIKKMIRDRYGRH